MRFKALATDYDGTLPHHGVVSESAVQALERLRKSGRYCLLVPGREMKDLYQLFPRLDLFHVVVAENGAILFNPQLGETKALHAPRPPQFAAELSSLGVSPLSIGHVLVATLGPHEKAALQVVKKLGLELEIIFNIGSVMILPTGCNKATGLKAALKELGLSNAHSLAPPMNASSLELCADWRRQRKVVEEVTG